METFKGTWMPSTFPFTFTNESMQKGDNSIKTLIQKMLHLSDFLAKLLFTCANSSHQSLIHSFDTITGGGWVLF